MRAASILCFFVPYLFFVSDCSKLELSTVLSSYTVSVVYCKPSILAIFKMSSGGHEDDRGDGSFHSIDFEFEWSCEPTFRDILYDYSVGTSGHDQKTFAGEADVFFGDFVPDTVLRTSDRLDQFNDKDSPASTSTPSQLLPFNPALELTEFDLDTSRGRYGRLDSS